MEQKVKNYLSNEDFSIVLGGPFFQFLRKAKLSGNGLEEARRRTLVLSLTTWLPLLLLSFISGKALSGSTTIPFLEDIGAHIRFLVAVPIMVFAELLVHKRMRIAVRQFVDRKIITEATLDKYHGYIHSALKLRNSFLAEAIIVLFVYIVGVHFIWKPFAVLNTNAWYADSTPDGNKLSLAGYWFGYVSTPLFQFLQLRWYYRLFIWSRFLWQVSRLELNLNPLHPDKVGGLGFLAEIDTAFLPLAMTHGAVLSGLIADQIFHIQAKLTDFQFEIGIIVVFIWLIFLVPLLFFTSQLAHSKRKGIIEYGNLGSTYVDDFSKKWIQNSAPNEEALIGSADIQSLADLSNSYEVVKKMQLSPITKESIISLTVITLLPVFPLLLTMMPLAELAKKLFEIIL